jgi:hypothetical protein
MFFVKERDVLSARHLPFILVPERAMDAPL